MVELEIDEQSVSVPEGTSIIEAAEALGIYIPRYCYHKKLSIAANCRMCLVEVVGVGKTLPACATPITAGMKVYTTSAKTLEAQRSVMEFLLINHPLDCPVCDQGGMCELQDLAVGFGRPYSYFDQGKRSVFSEDIGPLIDTWMTRCIQCTRCVRFGEEIAGMRELGVLSRGDKEEIGTYVKSVVRSELSGNMIDICPVGALTSKPNRYAARGWEMLEHASIAAHDCVGSNIYVHSRGHQYQSQRTVMNVVPRENEAVNETWISDRDRFSYLGLQHEDRIFKPLMKHQGSWQEAPWQRVLSEIADRMRAIVGEQGADQLAFLASPNSTTEEFYVLQKLARSLGCHNVDHRLKQQDFAADEVMPVNALGMSLENIEDLETIVLLGSNVRFDQPLISQRIRKATLNDATVFAINPRVFAYNFVCEDNIATDDILYSLAQVAKALQPNLEQLAAVEVNASAAKIAEHLLKNENAAIFLGTYALEHPCAEQIKALASIIAQCTQAKLGFFTAGCNTAGAYAAGAVPHRSANGSLLPESGLHCQQLFNADAVRAYCLLNMEPEYDLAYPAAALTALKKAGLVVCLTPYATDTMREYADFILPITPFTETSGSYVNVAGQLQSFAAVSPPANEVKPAWKVLRVLANFLELEGFDFKTEHEVLAELQSIKKEETTQALVCPTVTAGSPSLIRYAPTPIYRTDALVRRSEPLGKMQLNDEAVIRVNQKTAEALQLKASQHYVARQGNSEVTLPWEIDNTLADNTVLLSSALKETAGFGVAQNAIELQEVS